MAAGEILNAVGNKAGFISLFANLSLAAWISEVVGSWGLGDSAIVVSMVVSVMWCFKLRADYKLANVTEEKVLLEIELLKKKDKEK